MTMGTMLLTILLTGLFTLFVLLVLVALVYSLVRLLNGASTHDDVTTGENKQRSILNASVLHMIYRPGR